MKKRKSNFLTRFYNNIPYDMLFIFIFSICITYVMLHTINYSTELIFIIINMFILYKFYSVNKTHKRKKSKLNSNYIINLIANVIIVCIFIFLTFIIKYTWYIINLIVFKLSNHNFYILTNTGVNVFSFIFRAAIVSIVVMLIFSIVIFYVSYIKHNIDVKNADKSKINLE